MFVCAICDYSTNVKCNYFKHLNTKKHKKRNEMAQKNEESKQAILENDPKRPKMTQNDPKMTQNDPISEPTPQLKDEIPTCRFCGKQFSSKAHMRRHEMHRCKFNLNNSKNEKNEKNEKSKKSQELLFFKEKELLEKKHQKEKDKLFSTIEQLMERVGDTTHITHNNIILNNFGNEDMTHLTETILNNLIKGPYTMIPKAIEHVYFNNEKPENKNIYIPSRKEKYIKVFKDNKWVYENKKETIEDLVDRNYTILDNHYEEKGHKELNNSEIITYKEFQTKYDNKNKDLLERLAEDSELTILNNN